MKLPDWRQKVYLATSSHPLAKRHRLGCPICRHLPISTGGLANPGTNKDKYWGRNLSNTFTLFIQKLLQGYTHPKDKVGEQGINDICSFHSTSTCRLHPSKDVLLTICVAINSICCMILLCPISSSHLLYPSSQLQITSLLFSLPLPDCVEFLSLWDF